MFRKIFVVLALIASLAFITRSASAQSPCNDELRASLAEAAAKAGVPVNTDDILTSAREGVTLATATVTGYEQVPASALPEGVNAGFIYLDAKDSGIPAGFYTLRASASPDALRIGEFPGKVELVSVDGQSVASLPASIDAFSLEVPKPLPFPRTIITQDVQTSTDTAAGSLDAKRLRITITITIRCPNGSTIRITIRF
jgi:hypothetical protein